MRSGRARYVTLCQQSLATAVVLVVGLSAAGVETLDIVPRPGSVAGARDGVPGGLPRGALAEHREGPAETEVDAAPVSPKVREVRVTGISARAPGATAGTAPSKQQAQRSRSGNTGTAPNPTATKSLVALSDPQPVGGYATVGVTWKHGVDYSEDQLGVQVRTEKNGTWSDWIAADYHDEHGPDVGSVEDEARNERPGTDALVIGDVDQVQMRAETTDGDTPPDLRLSVINPGTGTMVKAGPAIDTAKLDAPPGARHATNASAGGPRASGARAVQDTVALSAMRVAPKPRIYSRAQWGANERMRDQSRPSYGTVKAGFIHHTVNANGYTSAQVPSLLRGIYAYHTQSRGWRDIGYNYLVDRFGRIWEGRYGGVTRAVVGAHTLGYNEVSFAMSALGNFDIARPPAAMVNAYTRLLAWKLSIYGIRANNPRVRVKNRWLHAVNGHRDAGQTACPGRYLYARIPYIRTVARRVQRQAQSGTTPTPKPTPKPTPMPTPPAFTSPTQPPRPAVAQPSGITFPKATNLAGARHPDLVLKSRSTGAIRVLPTGGQTGFGRAVTTPGSWHSMDLIAATGDLTGDGRGDVLARNARTGLTKVYRGDGAGHVRVVGINATRRFRSANLVVAAGDWNGDRHRDVLMRTKTTGALYLLPGTGTGGFGMPKRLSKAWGGFTSTAVAGDLNGDRRPDIVGINKGVLYVVPNTADGTLGRRIRRDAVGNDYNAVLGGAGDLDNDGRGDVVVRSSKTGGLAILTGRSGATFGPRLGWFGSLGLRHLSGGQMVGGTQPDVVGTNPTGNRLVVLPSNGLTNVAKTLPSNLRVSTATQVLSVGDWNRDGKGDVITRQASGDILMLRPGQGDGKFAKGVRMSRGWRPVGPLSAVGDVTGDRFPDLAGRTSGAAMRIFPGNGRTSFLAPVVAPASLRTFNQIGAGTWRPASMPSSSFVSSDGSFVPFAGTTGGNLNGYDWVIGPGDVDGYGVADMVARDSAGTLWLLPGTSRGYLARRYLAAGYQGYSLGG